MAARRHLFPSRFRGPLRAPAGMAAALVLAGCGSAPPAPPPLVFEGLPVSGNRSFAERLGFHACVALDAVHVRCRRGGVVLFGQQPLEAAVDLDGTDDRAGFDRLTLWRSGDQDALYWIVVPLTRAGWRYCYTGTEQAGDQAVFTKPGEPVRLSLDISYYGKRRLRILPNANPAEKGRRCVPDGSLVRFGAEIARAAQAPSPPR
jgi:hypothetical protein